MAGTEAEAKAEAGVEAKVEAETATEAELEAEAEAKLQYSSLGLQPGKLQGGAMCRGLSAQDQALMAGESS